MDLHRLEIFCKVVELKSFTLAAESLLLSQPTVSEHIRALEEIVGEKLVDRQGREVRLTPAGEILQRYAGKMLRLREEARQALADYRGELLGKLVIGASTIPGSYLLPKAIGAFKANHPAVRITLKIANTAAIADAVIKGEFGLGLIGLKSPVKHLNYEVLCPDELTLTVFPEHPFAVKGEVELPELYEQPFIIRERGSGTQMAAQQILAAHGFEYARLKVAAQMPNTEAVRQSIKARVGIGILSRLAVAADIDYGALTAVTIRGVEMRRPIYLVQRQHHQLPPIYQTFEEFLRLESGKPLPDPDLINA